MSDPVRAATARLGAATRWGTPDEVATARKALAAAKLRRAINEALAHFPPLDAATKAEAARLLMKGGDQ